ncbi:2-phosphosulfolactate phosphatase [Nocardia barduliensis]|uniref:2-phosphosulfolactate phosphatase n=1 Tax=Nocardia barduliensis TaxID=2736643 RepID=UPI001573739C|nr:2-phosphosulfolactate phosphatase [Nocardia barduliensis]
MKSAGPVGTSESVVWRGSLSSFKIFGSLAPAAFDDKRQHFPHFDASATSGVIVDVLRATTSLVAITGAGCRGVYVDVKPKTGDYPFIPPNPLPIQPGEWIYGGELNGRPIRGVDADGNPIDGVIGNSPREVRPAAFEGKLLRFFSSNGSKAIQSMMHAGLKSAHVMCLANIESTVEAVLSYHPDRIWLSCGGFYGSGSMEDSIACGIAISDLIKRGFATEHEIDDDAQHMLMAARWYLREGCLATEELIAKLRNQQVGRLLTDIGHGGDIEAAVAGIGMQGRLWDDMAAVKLKLATNDHPFLVPDNSRTGAKNND